MFHRYVREKYKSISNNKILTLTATIYIFFVTIFHSFKAGIANAISYGFGSMRGNPQNAGLYNINSYPLEVVSLYCDPQLQVGKNYSHTYCLQQNKGQSSKVTSHYSFKPSRCIKASFHIPENRPNFPTTKGFRTEISMKLVYQYSNYPL